MNKITPYTFWLQSVIEKVDQPTAEDIEDLKTLAEGMESTAPRAILDIVEKIKGFANHTISATALHKAVCDLAERNDIHIFEKTPLERMITPSGPSPGPSKYALGPRPPSVTGGEGLETIFSPVGSRENSRPQTPDSGVPFPIPEKPKE